MEICINFALPIECYDNMLNKCAGRFCHVETSLTIDVSMLRFLFDAVLEKSYAPNLCQSIVNNLKNKQGEITVAFYILFGDILSMRVLDDKEENVFYQPPTESIYETVTLTLEEEKMYDVIKWNICMLGRNYDIIRAVLLLSPITFSSPERPEKFFCSQLIMYMLKENNIINIEDSLNIDHMKPDHVYQWLVEKVNSIKVDEKKENGQ